MSREGLGFSEATGRAIADVLVKQAAELNDVLLMLQPRLGGDEFDAARRRVGRVLGETYLAGLFPLFHEFPKLKPPIYPG